MPLLSLLLACVSADPQVFTGKVIKVTDGDTIQVLVGKETIKVRLVEIDAPEKGQDFGTKARQLLGDKIMGKTVSVTWSEKDRHGRTLGEVQLDKENVNHWLVREGLAWQYKKYSKSKELERLEKEAREAKRGLWSLPTPVPPWEWRSRRRASPK